MPTLSVLTGQLPAIAVSYATFIKVLRSKYSATAAFFHMTDALSSFNVAPHDPSIQPVVQGAENDTHQDGSRFRHPSW